MQQQALIYCRVSSEKQKTIGHGLESQEHRCRDYASQQSYIVAQVFKDSYSGGGDFVRRPAMRELLAYLDEHPDINYVVIFDDLKRFARDTIFHWKLRQELEMRSATVECLNFRFEDTPEGEFIETIIAAQGELERKQISRQVLQKMKARLEKGYWTFNAYIGYRMEKVDGHGKLLVPDEPKASQITEALEGFASGRFQTQSAVQRHLQESDFLGGRKVHAGTVERMLRRVIYAGYVEYMPWGVSRRLGQHEALISLGTFQKIQDKLDSGKRTFTRRDMRADFPLRGFVTCTGCGKLLTASWSRGRSGTHAYYRCARKPSACSWGGKSVQQTELHDDWGNLLLSYQPTQKVVPMVMKAARDLWEQEYSGMAARQRTANERELKKVRRQADALLEKIAIVESETVLKALEKKVEELNGSALVIEAKLADRGADAIDFGTALDAVLGLFKNLYDTWDNDDLGLKIMVQKAVSDPPCPYDRNTRFGTAQIPLIPAIFQQFEVGNSYGVNSLKNNWNQLKDEVVRIYYLLRAGR